MPNYFCCSLSKWQPRLHAPEIDMMKERFAKLLLGEDSEAAINRSSKTFYADLY